MDIRSVAPGINPPLKELDPPGEIKTMQTLTPWFMCTLSSSDNQTGNCHFKCHPVLWQRPHLFRLIYGSKPHSKKMSTLVR